MKIVQWIVSLTLCMASFAEQHMVSHITAWDQEGDTGRLYVTLKVTEDDAIYDEYVRFFSDSGDLVLGEPAADQQPTLVYDSAFKENKTAFCQDVTWCIPLQITDHQSPVQVRFTYYSKRSGQIEESYLAVASAYYDDAQEVDADFAATCIATQGVEITTDAEPTAAVQDATMFPDEDDSWYCTVSRVLEDQDALAIRLFLVFILGLLLSLTPCIYPMIPITIGILQGQGSTSWVRNLLVSLCYTAGVASTFACLGLVAAYTGTLFGTAMQHPLVIGLLILLLAYFAGSMVGLYELYIPTFLRPGATQVRGGSPVAAFLFGIVSGTMASPCVSPGLALVLGMVTKLAHPLIGFALLFAFGIGLSFPLLIVGTFSGSLHILPKAGFWMVEIKRIFGFAMFGVCLYLLSSIMPVYIVAAITTLLCLILACYYLYSSVYSHSLYARLLASLLGIALLVSAVLSAYVAVRFWYEPQQCTIIGVWTKDYACAVQQAQHQHKRLFVKIEAPCCSLCRVINSKFFSVQSVVDILKQYYVPVSIDGSRTDDPVIKEIMQRYAVVGFPTILIIDPADGQLIKQWVGEVHTYTVEQFIGVLEQYGR